MAERTTVPAPSHLAGAGDEPNIPLLSRPEGGIWLTLAVIACVEIFSRTLFVIPKPSSIYFLVIAAATTLGGMRIGLVSALLVILASVLTMSDPGHLFHFLAAETTVRIAIFCLTAPATAVIVGGLRRRNERLAWERTERARAEERAVAALARERRIVEALQNNLLSQPAADTFPGLLVAMRYESALDEAEVGGDFFDTFTLTDGRVALLVGDVSGKGLAAASRTAASKYTLRTLLRDCRNLGDAVAQANRFLVQDLERADRESPRALPSFACLSLGVIDPESGDIEIVVAGMDPPVIVRADTGRAEILEAEGMPLGISEAATYQPLRRNLGHGDLLVFATDGITEARDATRVQFFGIAGLRSAAECVARLDSLDAATGALLDAAKRFTPKGSLSDDACLLLARRL